MPIVAHAAARAVDARAWPFARRIIYDYEQLSQGDAGQRPLANCTRLQRLPAESANTATVP